MLKVNVKIIGVVLTYLLILSVNLGFADPQWIQYTAENSPLTSNSISSINFDGDNNQYVCTSGGGLIIKNNDNWTIFNESNTGTMINTVRVVGRDPNNDLWVGAATGNLDSAPQGFGVARMNTVDSTWTMENSGLEVNQIITGVMIGNENRYVSTYGGGLTIYNASGWTRYRVASRAEFSYADSQLHIFDVSPGTYLPSDYIRAIDIDQISGAIWVGTADGGVVWIVNNNWTTFNTGNSGLPSNQILSIKINQVTGEAYFGTAGLGMAMFDGLIWTHHNQSNSPMISSFITAIDISPLNGEVWLGTLYDILVLEQSGAWRVYPPNQNNLVWGDFYSDISFDSSGNVWVAAYNGGMAVLLPDSLPPPPSSDSLYFSFNRFKITFMENRPVEKITTIFSVTESPELALEDTISFRLESEFGELYFIEAPFGDFRHASSPNGPRNQYSYKSGKKTITLRYDSYDWTAVSVKITDRDAGMNRENYSDALTATFRMGSSTGILEVDLIDGILLNIPTNDSGVPDGLYRGIALNNNHGERDIVITESDIFHSNFPNPFNGQTNIKFSLSVPGDFDIAVYDILGRKVSNLYHGYLNSGDHQFTWPETDSKNNYNTGVYYYRVVSDRMNNTGKMIYLK